MKTNQLHNKPFKLENVSKKEIFSVPDGYFDKLPSIIQNKAIESTKKKTYLVSSGVLKLAFPFIALILIVGYFGYKFQNNSSKFNSNIELMLASVSTEEMVNFLDESDISSDDLLELVSFEGEAVDDISYELDDISDADLELLINEFDFENTNNI